MSIHTRRHSPPSPPAAGSAVRPMGFHASSFGCRQQEQLGAPDERKDEGDKSPLEKPTVAVKSEKNQDGKPCIEREHGHNEKRPPHERKRPPVKKVRSLRAGTKQKE